MSQTRLGQSQLRPGCLGAAGDIGRDVAFVDASTLERVSGFWSGAETAEEPISRAGARPEKIFENILGNMSNGLVPVRSQGGR
jgi:hypothetical protein